MIPDVRGAGRAANATSSPIPANKHEPIEPDRPAVQPLESVAAGRAGVTRRLIAGVSEFPP